MDDKKISRTLSTTETSFRIIESLKEDSARLTEIATELDLPASTVHNHLSTLLQCGYVAKEGDMYRLGLGFLELGERARTNKESYTVAESYTEQLADETQCRAVFAAEEHGKGVYIHTFSGKHAVWTYSTLGKRFGLHTTAVGKAILSEFSEDKLDSIIDRHGLYPKPKTRSRPIGAARGAGKDRRARVHSQLRGTTRRRPSRRRSSN